MVVVVVKRVGVMVAVMVEVATAVTAEEMVEVTTVLKRASETMLVAFVCSVMVTVLRVTETVVK